MSKYVKSEFSLLSITGINIKKDVESGIIWLKIFGGNQKLKIKCSGYGAALELYEQICSNRSEVFELNNFKFSDGSAIMTTFQE